MFFAVTGATAGAIWLDFRTRMDKKAHRGGLALVWLGLVYWLALWPCLVAAQTAPVESPDYRASIDLAVGEYELGNFAEARAQFQRAHALYPNARSLRGLGMTEFELRNYPDSIRYLQRALAAEEKPLQGPLRTHTEKLLEDARGYVASVTLNVEPSTATLSVDGIFVELDRAEPLLLPVGDHLIELTAPGRATHRRALKVSGGETLDWQITMREATEELAAKPRWYKNPWLWTAVGVVVVGAATGAGFALRDPGSKLSPAEGGTTETALMGPKGGQP